MTGTSSKLAALMLFTSILFTSCNNNIIYSEIHKMPGAIWKLDDVAKYRVEISDTISSNNVIFTLRSGPKYPFRNIWLFVSTVSPDGKTITDTLNFTVADEKGRSPGKGLGDIRELDLPYKSNVFFPLKGTYRFTVRHGMRSEDLPDVYDLGMRIENISKH